MCGGCRGTVVVVVRGVHVISRRAAVLQVGDAKQAHKRLQDSSLFPVLFLFLVLSDRSASRCSAAALNEQVLG